MLRPVQTLTFLLTIGSVIVLIKGQIQCPSPNGYFPDAVQCDKYLSCTNGVATEKLCQDGLVFNSQSPLYERCDLPFRAKCAGRELLQTPSPSLHCPRQNGLFTHEDPSSCGHFWSCEKGKATPMRCPEGLVFSEPTGGCEWPDVAQRCDAEAFLGFKCPTLEVQSLQDFEHTRYPHQWDCKKFYICLHRRSPRLLQCPDKQVFNWQTLACDEPLYVPGCENYYPPSPSKSPTVLTLTK